MAEGRGFVRPPSDRRSKATTIRPLPFIVGPLRLCTNTYGVPELSPRRSRAPQFPPVLAEESETQGPRSPSR